MNPSLTRAEGALARIPGMAGARVAGRMVDGPTNATYLVQRGDEAFVLRLDKPATRTLGLDRENEKRVCAAVAEAGLTPAYLHFDPAGGVSLRPFVQGRCLSRDDLLDRDTLARLARSLGWLHGLPPVGARFDPLAAARRYAAQLGTPRSASLAVEAASLMAEIDRGRGPAVLCHNDLVAENLLLTRGRDIVLIDWEYAAIGDPLFDLAVVVRHHGLPEELSADFLASYLQGPPNQRQRARFGQQCAFYGCLLELWNLRVGAGGAA